MKYTTPTKPGWYWFRTRSEGSEKWDAAPVYYQDGENVWINGLDWVVENCVGEWGPRVELPQGWECDSSFLWEG
jgi:hypothetical protein